MNTPATVAVCILTYNRGYYLKEALESVLQQTYRHMEIWVGDDNSTDQTQMLLAHYSCQHTNLHCLYNQEHIGRAALADRLLRMPKTEWIVRLNADQLLHSSYVQTLMALLTQYPEAATAICNMQEIDEHGAEGKKRPLQRNQVFYSGDRTFRESIYDYKSAVHIPMFRRSALEALNFMAGRPEGTEAYDLWVRLAAAGWGNVFSDHTLAYYRIHSNRRESLFDIKTQKLHDYIRISDEVFIPAFHERHWNTQMLEKQRQTLALEYAIYLLEAKLSEENKEHIMQLLIQLSNTPSLKKQLDLHGHPNSLKAWLCFRKRHVNRLVKKAFSRCLKFCSSFMRTHKDKLPHILVRGYTKKQLHNFRYAKNGKHKK